MNPSRTKTFVLSGAAASILLLTAACGSDDSTESDTASTEESTTDSSPSTETTDDSSDEQDSSGSYVAGDYSAEGSYSTPGGTQSIEVELSLDADGTITDIIVTPLADGGNSEQFQTKFASGIAAEVVGKKIDDLNVSKVSGSSLTSGGFNEAIDEIKDEAAA